MAKVFTPYLYADTVDDLMRQSIQAVLDYGVSINPSRGPATELSGITLELARPRARISQSSTRGKIISALGELCWYLSGSDDADCMAYYISRYIENADDYMNGGRQVNGAYGPRLFSPNAPKRFENVRKILGDKVDSRQAVIQIFDNEDIEVKHVDVPCTCLLQFMLRDSRLSLIVYMRSNDAMKGLPHDIFSFTMLQEIMACSLGVELGTYKHIVGSFHLYQEDEERAKQFLAEGWHSRELEMPPMPSLDPWPAIRHFLKTEETLRLQGKLGCEISDVQPYWADLIRLLQVHSLTKRGDKSGVASLLEELSNGFYTPFLISKLPTELA